MGQFSWIYSDTGKQVLDNHRANTYLLIPEPFQVQYGKHLYELCYDGYGHFAGQDIYILTAVMNREFIPEVVSLMKNGKWKCSNKEKDIRILQSYAEGEDPEDRERMRWIGILLACYDEDNFRLKYPIKITSKPMRYEDAEPSETDPNQGW